MQLGWKSRYYWMVHVYYYYCTYNVRWLSEKLDGVRAFWDGERLLSRNGKVLNIPPHFTCTFPKKELDGELWMGKQTLEKLLSLLNSDWNDEDWHSVHYGIFDIPNSRAPYEDRMKELQQLTLPSCASIVHS